MDEAELIKMIHTCSDPQQRRLDDYDEEADVALCQLCRSSNAIEHEEDEMGYQKLR